MKPLVTERLWIIPCDTSILEAAIRSDEALSERLGVDVPAFWTEFGNEPLEYSLSRILEHPEEMGWWTWLPIHKTERVLMGSGGFKGKHGTDGVLEIGYEITPHYRGQGYAQEMALALVQYAFSFPGVLRVIAHTMPNENPSTSVLRRVGFIKIGEYSDPEDGPVWQWAIDR